MKKNRFLKVASAMIILCLITTCAVSTTFAKYTTAGSASDAARVAKWGVTITMDGDPAFASQYTDTTNGLTVKSDNGDKVVAPGTSSSEVAGGLRFAITGTPEVAVDIKIEFTVNNDIFLATGDHLDETTANDLTDTFNLLDEYHPVVFTLKQTKNASGAIDQVLKTGTLAEIQAFLTDYSNGAGSKYAPNTVLDSEFELSWAWVIDGNDQADTFLGNRMAAGTTGAEYSLKIGYTLKITAEQID